MKKLFLLGLLLLLAIAPVYAENETVSDETDSEVYTRTFTVAVEKAIAQAEEIISKVSEQGNGTTELQSILDEFLELNGTEVTSRDEYKEVRADAKQLVEEFRTAAREFIPEDKRDEIRERAREKAKERVAAAREKIQELREKFNEKALRNIAQRIKTATGNDVDFAELRNSIRGNYSAEEIREKVKMRVKTFMENRSELISTIKERVQDRQEQIQERIEDRIERNKDIRENVRERREEIRETARDTQDKAEELKEQYEAGEITLDEFNAGLAELRRQGLKDILGDDELADEVSDLAEEIQEDIENDLDADGDGEISEEEALALVNDLGIEVPQ